MLFKDVPGLQGVKKILIELVNNNRLPHAVMLRGPEQSVALPLALALSTYLHCDNRSGDDSCGTCAACRKTSKHVHPDLHFTYPVIPRKSGDKPVSTDYINEWREALIETPFMNYYEWMDKIGAENKQGNITAEECNQIMHNLNLKAFESRYKVQLIWLPEYLGNVGNKLLKVLEEPTDNTFFILITEDSEKILNTILSRCQHFNVPQLAQTEVTDFMQSKFSISADEAGRIARMADGSISAALQLQEGISTVNEELCLKWFRLCFGLYSKNHANAAAELAPFIDEQLAKSGREKQKSFLKYCLYMLRESLQLKFTGRCSLSETELPFANHISKSVDIEQLQKMQRIIEKLHYHIERNANPKITFFQQTLELSRVINHMPLLSEAV